MAIAYNPKIATDGLVLCLDAANQKSNGNNLINTHDLTAAGWGAANSTLTATEEVISPIGTPVFKMTGTGGGRTYLVQGYQSFSKVSSWTSSIYVHAGTYNFARLSPSIASNADGVVINLTTGAVVRVPYSRDYNTFTVSPVGNGWFRISRTRQNDSYRLKCFALYMTSYLGNADVGAGQTDQFPANGEFIYVTAPQFEHTTSPRPYFQNNGTTRNWKSITGLNNEAVRLNGADFASTTSSDIAMEFDGVDDYGKVIHDNLLNVNNSFSISVWAFPNVKNETYRILITKGYRVALSSVNASWIIRHARSISNHNTLFGQIRTDNGSFTASWTPYSTNFDEKWHNYILVVNTNWIYLYVDGVQVASTAFTGNVVNNTRDITIGRGDLNDTGEFWSGKIANVQIYNKSLTDTEVQQNFNATRGRYGI